MTEQDNTDEPATGEIYDSAEAFLYDFCEKNPGVNSSDLVSGVIFALGAFLATHHAANDGEGDPNLVAIQMMQAAVVMAHQCVPEAAAVVEELAG